jgi:hypothetical protein
MRDRNAAPLATHARIAQEEADERPREEEMRALP